MLVLKYSEMLLHDFRMANFGWEMADGQLLCYKLYMCVCVYMDLLICVCVTATAITLIQCVYHIISIFLQ